MVTFLLFGVGNVSLVYLDGMTKEIVQPLCSVCWTMTGAVMAIFSGPLPSGATLSPKMNPAISWNPKFIAVFISTEQQEASAVRQEGYCLSSTICFRSFPQILETTSQLNFSTLAFVQRPAPTQSPQRVARPNMIPQFQFQVILMIIPVQFPFRLQRKGSENIFPTEFQEKRLNLDFKKLNYNLESQL